MTPVLTKEEKRPVSGLAAPKINESISTGFFIDARPGGPQAAAGGNGLTSTFTFVPSLQIVMTVTLASLSPFWASVS